MQTLNNISNLYERRKELRNNATKEEKIIWEHLRNSKLGVKFRRQHSIGGYVVDFYCPLKKLIVEIDGGIHLKKENKEYDDIREKFLVENDFKILRFTNDEVNGDFIKVVEKIDNYIHKSPPPSQALLVTPPPR